MLNAKLYRLCRMVLLVIDKALGKHTCVFPIAVSIGLKYLSRPFHLNHF